MLLGIGIMWLGARNFAYLRIAVFHVAVIWLISLFLPTLLDHPRLSPSWTPRIRLMANFFNKNLYQQVLFFVLPIYYDSATITSGNFFFVVLVGLSATLSTLDIIYDRHLAARRSLTALFFAFNLFVLINVMLPVLWSLSNTWTTRIGAAAAALSLLSFYYSAAKPRMLRIALPGIIAVSLIVLVELGRPYIPPAGLRLTAVEFATDFERTAMQIESPLTELSPARALWLYGLTAIKAPLGSRSECATAGTSMIN